MHGVDTSLQELKSEDWPSYTDSILSMRHVDEKDKLRRTNTMLYTIANTMKLYVGIVIVTTSYNIADVGIFGALGGFCFVLAMNLYCTNLLLYARNRFKRT